MKKWQDTATKAIASVILLQGIAWATWITKTVIKIETKMDLLLLKASLTISDAKMEIPKSGPPTLNADMALPTDRFYEWFFKKENNNGRTKTGSP